MNSSLMSYLQATLRTEFTLIANTSGKLLTFGMILMFVAFFSTLQHTEKFTLVMIAGLAGNILMTALTWWYANRFEKVRFAWDSEYIRHILRISLPYGVALFLNVIFFKVDTILLSVMTPKSLADTVVALYALPMKIVEVGMMYGTIFLNSLLPLLTVAFAKSEYEKARTLIRHGAILMFSGGLFASLVLYFGAETIIRMISTPSFVETVIYGGSSVEALRIVAWIFLVYSLSSLSTYVLIAKNEQRKMLRINLFVALLNIIGNILIIPHYSFIGSTWVTLATQVILLVLTTWSVRNSFLLSSSIEKPLSEIDSSSKNDKK